MKVLVIQSCLTLCYPMDYNLPGCSVHRILQVRIESELPFLSPGNCPDPGTELGFPALQAYSLPSESLGKPNLKEKGATREGSQSPKKETAYNHNLYMSFMFFFLLKLVWAFQFTSERTLIQLIYILWCLMEKDLLSEKEVGMIWKEEIWRFH